MIITFDTETRGLFGDIFIMGMYDGREFRIVKPNEFFVRLARYEEPVFAYAHNLDFDFSKLWKAVGGIDIDWGQTIIIHHSLVRVKLAGLKVYLCDSFRLFPSSLEKLTKDFELAVGKMDIEDYIKEKGYKNKEEFFKNISPDDATLREYLKHDCIALYELLQKAISFSGLGEDEFCKCPTTPSLSMRIYQKMCSDEYQLIVQDNLTKELEEFGREAYIGARVEVVKPILNQEGYHYDVNSLYPYVMKENSFPVGKYTRYDGGMCEFAFKVFKEGGFKHGLIKAKVDVPEDTYIPLLPFRDDKLYFPVGRFEGCWTAEELRMAEEFGAVVKPESGVFWQRGEKVFEKFILVMEKEKISSKGARRNFFKLIQNSLYGKFGMKREREAYFPVEKEKMLIEKGRKYLRINLDSENEVLVSTKIIRADYIRPHIAAYVTSYARMYLYKGIMINPATVYYYDTDSLVLDCELPAEMIDDKEYGKWKLEGRIEKAVFLQPKLYAEIRDGKEVLKSTGLIADYRKEMTFNTYLEILQAILEGEKEIILYDNVPARRKFISALKLGKDLDEPVLLRKRLNLFAKQKREMDFRANNSKPLKFYTW